MGLIPNLICLAIVNPIDKIVKLILWYNLAELIDSFIAFTNPSIIGASSPIDNAIKL